MVRDELSVLSAFLAVAEERSFTRAAKRLNVSTSGLSHAIRRLEEQIGLQLLARTTRSVSPTPAGQQLIEHLRPALTDIRETLTQISELQTRPVGRLRLLIPRFAAKTVVAPKLGEFVRNYPDVVLEITTDDTQHVDLVAAGYDAGIHFGEFIAQDMVAVRVSPDIRPAIVGAPAYFATRPRPASPRDLVDHRCILFRHRGEAIYRWELDKDDQSLTVDVQGPVIVDDVELVIGAALAGVGLAFLGDDHAGPYLASGALERVLDDWSPPFPGFFLYYPSRRQQPAALAALIETLRI
jgi:DNA-binding transcriptional LysR family regulator